MSKQVPFRRSRVILVVALTLACGDGVTRFSGLDNFEKEPKTPDSPPPPVVVQSNDTVSGGMVVVHATNSTGLMRWLRYPVEDPLWAGREPEHPFGESEGIAIAIDQAPAASAHDVQGFVAGQEIVAFFAGGYGNGPASGFKAALVDGSGNFIQGLHIIESRGEHAMTVLSGRRVLLTGGYSHENPPRTRASSEIFHVDDRSNSVAASMRLARYDHALVTLKDGRAMVSGGMVPTDNGEQHNPSATTEIYNAATDTFSDGPNMSVARHNHSAIALDDGRMLVLGGNGSSTAEVYSPVSNSFGAVINMAVVHGSGSTAVKLLNGMVLVAGGDNASGQPSAVVELFDPALNLFFPLASMKDARSDHFSALMGNGKVIVGGGRGASGQDVMTVEIYDPVTNTWTYGPALPFAVVNSPAFYIRRAAELPETHPGESEFPSRE